MVAKNDSNMEITEEEFSEVINNSHKIVVVNFFADWCMPCLMLAPLLEELASDMREAKFVKINIDDNEELARKYSVVNVPCLVILRKGKETGRIVGNQPPEIIEEKIKRCLKES